MLELCKLDMFVYKDSQCTTPSWKTCKIIFMNFIELLHQIYQVFHLIFNFYRCCRLLCIQKKCKNHMLNKTILSLATETSKDPMMQALKHQIIKGWPHSRSECGKNLQDFWNYRDELLVLDGLVLKGSCIVIPELCRDEILDQLHEGHFGIDRTKLCTRDSVYWPNIKT